MINARNIKKSANIIIIAQKLGLKLIELKNGEYKSLCPFHNEQTSSFFISSTKQNFHCFGCGEGGDIFDLIMKIQNISFKEALLWLNDGSTLNYSNNIYPQLKIITNTKINYEILNYFYSCCEPISDEAKNYLIKRGISKSLMNEKFMKWTPKFYELRGKMIKKYKTEELKSSGLFNDKMNFKFGYHRLIWPYFNEKESVCYIQGRNIYYSKDNSNTHKEMNLCGEIPFLYNTFNQSNSDHVFLCEGVIDTLSLLSIGYNAVGMPSTIFKKEWVANLPQLIFLIIDHDTGRTQEYHDKINKISEKIYSIDLNKDIRIINLPEGKDVNDFLNPKNGEFQEIEAFRDLINHSEQYVGKFKKVS